MRSFLSLCQQSDFPIPRGQSSDFQGPSLLPLIYEGGLVSLLGEVSVALERLCPLCEEHCVCNLSAFCRLRSEQDLAECMPCCLLSSACVSAVFFLHVHSKCWDTHAHTCAHVPSDHPQASGQDKSPALPSRLLRLSPPTRAPRGRTQAPGGRAAHGAQGLPGAEREGAARGGTDKAGVQWSPALAPRKEGAAARAGPMSWEPEWDFLPESRWP